LATPAELAALLDAGALTVAAPTEHPMLGVAESRWVAPQRLVEAAQWAREGGYFLESMTCVDRLEPHGVFELIYTFNRYDSPARVALRAWVPRGLAVPSLAGVFAIADWNEREAWELYGVEFSGHPDLTWLLLPEGTEFRPLLKSFAGPPPSSDDGAGRPSARLE